MALSCGIKCAKSMLIVFNLTFWLSGCALIAFGIFILIEEEKSTLFPLFRGEKGYADLQYLAFGVIGIGSLVFIVGFFGCCGAMQENKCLLIVYLIFIIIISASELVIGIFSLRYTQKMDAELEGHLLKTLKMQYGVDQHTTTALDFAQTKFHCCGVLGPYDYADSSWRKNEGNHKNVTPSCCVRKNSGEDMSYQNTLPINETLCQRDDVSNQRFRHQMGCLDKLKEFIKLEGQLFMSIGCGIAALEIFGIIFSICLCKEI